MSARNRSLIARVESMHAVALCLESYLWGDPHGDTDREKALIASMVAPLMADELEALIEQVNDDHIMAVPPKPEREPATVANKIVRRRKAVRRG